MGRTSSRDGSAGDQTRRKAVPQKRILSNENARALRKAVNHQYVQSGSTYRHRVMLRTHTRWACPDEVWFGLWWQIQAPYRNGLSLVV